MVKLSRLLLLLLLSRQPLL